MITMNAVDDIKMKICILFFMFSFKSVCSYSIYNVEDPSVCNKTIWLEKGPKSAAILQLTSKDSYDFTPLFCTITFKPPIHTWSGLTAVVEEVDMRKYWDTTDHHLSQDVCVDYIAINPQSSHEPQKKLCGQKASVSYKSVPNTQYKGIQEHVARYCPKHYLGEHERVELSVEVSIGQPQKQNFLWKNTSWQAHKGFSLVVTAYAFPYGERGCQPELLPCGRPPGEALHCIDASLWCDNHANCCLGDNQDEAYCKDKGLTGGVLSVLLGPYMGALLLLPAVFGAGFCWRKARSSVPRCEPCPPTNQEFNSYAESYEVSSNLSSAHHMNIQVRVVCNSSHAYHSPRSNAWKHDLPPAYDSLFPHGPPSVHNAPNQIMTTSLTNDIATPSTSRVISPRVFRNRYSRRSRSSNELVRSLASTSHNQRENTGARERDSNGSKRMSKHAARLKYKSCEIPTSTNLQEFAQTIDIDLPAMPPSGNIIQIPIVANVTTLPPCQTLPKQKSISLPSSPQNTLEKSKSNGGTFSSMTDMNVNGASETAAAVGTSGVSPSAESSSIQTNVNDKQTESK